MSLSRRALIRNLSIAGGGLTLGFSLAPASSGAQPATVLAPNAYLQVSAAGEVLVQIHKAEMGQGVITGIVTLIAEELEVEPGTVRYQMAPVAKAFRDPEMRLQITGGSASMRVYYTILRQAGASARLMLLQAAANSSGRDLAELYAENGRIRTRDGALDLGYGELASAAAALSPPQDPPLKKASEFKLIGHHNRRLDLQPKVDGSAVFGIDAPVPEAPVAVVVRSPAIGGRITDANREAAAALPGVLQVVDIDAGIAVVGRNYWRARKAAEALDIKWQPGESPLKSSADIEQALTKPFEDDDFNSVRNTGEASDIAAQQVLEAEYDLPFLAHAAMEPLNATVVPSKDTAEVWVGSQSPDTAQAFAAIALGLSKEDVTIHNTLLGGGFGRRAAADNVYEAAQIARAIGGPVKLVWSREDDMQHDLYRPAMKSRLRAELAADGTVQSWNHRLAGPSVMQHTIPVFGRALAPSWTPNFALNLAANIAAKEDDTSIEGAADIPYEFGHIEVGYRNVETPVPLGFWRSVGHSHNAFVVESFVDELAHASGSDPLTFRRLAVPADSRHRQVLDRVAAMADWGNAPANRFHGLAVHESFHSVVAQVIEISLRDGHPVLERAWCAIHCGLVINPDIVVAQMEGGMIFGLTAALRGEITLQDGAVQQSNFHDYAMLRMNEVPEIEVAIIDSDAPPTGVGEPATPPAAPALANAIFAATGQRLRKLPLKLNTKA